MDQTFQRVTQESAYQVSWDGLLVCMAKVPEGYSASKFTNYWLQTNSDEDID